MTTSIEKRWQKEAWKKASAAKEKAKTFHVTGKKKSKLPEYKKKTRLDNVMDGPTLLYPAGEYAYVTQGLYVQTNVTPPHIRCGICHEKFEWSNYYAAHKKPNTYAHHANSPCCTCPVPFDAYQFQWGEYFGTFDDHTANWMESISVTRVWFTRIFRTVPFDHYGAIIENSTSGGLRYSMFLWRDLNFIVTDPNGTVRWSRKASRLFGSSNLEETFNHANTQLKSFFLNEDLIKENL